MNEKQPYEKHLADKLESLTPPGDSSKHWPAMKAMLDQQMPAKDGRPGPYWWMYGIIIGIVTIGTWFAIQQNKPESNQAAQKLVVAKNENNTIEPNKVSGSVSTTSSDNSTSSVKEDKTGTIAIETGAEEDKNKENNNQSKEEGKHTDVNKSTLIIKDESKGKPNQIEPGKDAGANSILTEKKQPIIDSEKPVKEIISEVEKKESLVKTSVKNNSGDEHDDNAGSPKKAGSNEKKIIVKEKYTNPEGLDRNKNVLNLNKVSGRNSQVVKAADKNSSRTNIVNSLAKNDTEVQLRPSLLAFTNESDFSVKSIGLVFLPDTIARDYAGNVKPTTIVARTRFKESNERTKALKNRVVGTGEEKNFVIGLTLPLSMPLSNQRVLSYNVNAGINTISDYIPSPNFQYHINKSSFLQAEIQLASPQFIQPVLLAQSKYELSAGQPGNFRFRTNSTYARKLYYFNLPIGINYSPFKNFYLGTGLQFSSLMSGIGFSETRGYNNLSPTSSDTLLNANFFKFRNDTLSGRLNSNELRLTLDANYYWKKFTLGMRYNQALNNYVSIQVTPTSPIFTDRNKALQFYLRYNLWEDRKKKKINSVANR